MVSLRNGPFVSIGIPTYNRSGTLERAINSALVQSYENIEVVISNNCSSDSTMNLCDQMKSKDHRVRVIHQDVVVSAFQNFMAVLKVGRGEFFMWLADDDEISPAYIEDCMRVLLHDPDCALAYGRPKLIYEQGRERLPGHFSLTSSSKVIRVCSYYWLVSENSQFYGVFRRRDALQFKWKDVEAVDWYFCAYLATQGKLLCVPSSYITRQMSSMSGAARLRMRYGGVARTALLYFKVAYRAFAFGWGNTRNQGWLDRLIISLSCGLAAGIQAMKKVIRQF